MIITDNEKKQTHDMRHLNALHNINFVEKTKQIRNSKLHSKTLALFQKEAYT